MHASVSPRVVDLAKDLTDHSGDRDAARPFGIDSVSSARCQSKQSPFLHLHKRVNVSACLGFFTLHLISISPHNIIVSLHIVLANLTRLSISQTAPSIQSHTLLHLHDFTHPATTCQDEVRSRCCRACRILCLRAGSASMWCKFLLK